MGVKFVQCSECRGRGRVRHGPSWQNMMLAKICLQSLSSGKDRRAAQAILEDLKKDPKVAEFIELWESDPDAAERKLEEEGP